MRTDNYPTRKEQTGSFIKRVEPVVYESSAVLTPTQNRKYKENGYLLIKNFFNIAEIAACLRASEIAMYNESNHVTDEPGVKAIRSVTGIHTQEPYATIAKNNLLLHITKPFLGSDVYIHQSRINYKSGISSNGWYWHSDFETWHAQDGMPGIRCMSAMIPLTENTDCNGSLMVIPKSHELFYACRKERQVSAEENFADQKEGVPDIDALHTFFEHSKGEIKLLTCSPGDLILFDCNTIHVSNPNMTPSPRTNLFFVYNSVENQLQEPFSTAKHRPEQMGTTKILEVL